MDSISQNRLGFEGASGSFSFDEQGDRDGFLDVTNWKLFSNRTSAFVKQWSWSSSLRLHNIQSSVTVSEPASPLQFFDGKSDVPPNQTPRAFDSKHFHAI